LATGLPGSSRSPVESVNGFGEQQSFPKLRISPSLATHEAMPWYIHRTDSQSRSRANHGRSKSKNVGDNVVAGFDLLASQTSSATGVDRIVLRLKFASDASSIGQPASRQQADFAPRSSPIDFGSSSFSRSQTAPRSRSLATGLPGSSRSPVEPVNGFWEQQSLPKLRISPGLATHEAMPWCIHRTDSQSRWRANHGRSKSKNCGDNVVAGFDLLVSWIASATVVHRVVPWLSVAPTLVNAIVADEG
jgi:hypothetical protein